MFIFSILISLLIPVALVGALIYGITRIKGQSDDATAGRVEVKHVLATLFGFILYIMALSGVAWLLGVLFLSGSTIGVDGSAEVAGAIALSVVSGPAFWLVWGYLSRLLDESGEFRTSALWSLFATATHLVSLFGAMICVGLTLDRLLTDDGTIGRIGAFALIYTAGTIWSWSLVDGRHRPAILRSLPLIGGSTLGLWSLVGGLAAVVSVLGEAAYARLFGVVVTDTGIGEPLVRSLIWVGMGAIVWWWYWLRHSRELDRSTARNVYLFLIAILPAVVAGLTSLIVVIYQCLSWLLGLTDDSAVEHFEGLFVALGWMALAAVVWAYHRAVVGTVPDEMRGDVSRTYRYLLSGVAVVAGATGIGMIVRVVIGFGNSSLLASDSDDGQLLAGAISVLVVALPVWLRMWSPLTAQKSVDEITSRPRRMYLSALAGLGGIAAVISLITLVYRLAVSLLEAEPFSTLVESVRDPLGFVVATGVVAGYHIAVWRRERPVVEAAEPIETEPRFVTLAAPDGDGLAAALGDAGYVVNRLNLASRENQPLDPGQVLAAIGATDFRRMLVVVDEDVRILEMS